VFIAELSEVLGITAGVVQLVGYWVYNTRAGKHLNVGSWLIWAIGGLIDLASYAALTHGDFAKDFLPAVCALAAIVTFGYSIYKKRFGWPDKEDFKFLLGDGAITIVWYFTTTVIANLLYQASAIVSFGPLLRDILSKNGKKEDPLAWAIWTIAYGLLAVSVVLRLNKWEEMAYPVTHFGLHLAVAIIAFHKRPAR
jgi:hypothetical protein